MRMDTAGRGGRLSFYFVHVAALLLALVFGVGCFGNKAPERTYYSVDYALTTQPRTEHPKYDATLVVQNITSALAYDRQEIVYRANPYEFQYYWYCLWASKPRKMLSELITAHLQYANLFKNVSTTIEDKLPDYLLDVHIVSIEELDVSETEWYAHMSLRFTMYRAADNSVVWNYTFDGKRQVADNRPVYVVKAMSEILDAELTKAFMQLDDKLSQEPLKRLSQFSATGSSGKAADEDVGGGSSLENVPSAVLSNEPHSGELFQ